MENGPLSKDDARDWAAVAFQTGWFTFSEHCMDQLADRNMTEIDVQNTVQYGKCTEVQFDDGEWCYKIETKEMAVIVTFDADELILVTAWRK